MNLIAKSVFEWNHMTALTASQAKIIATGNENSGSNTPDLRSAVYFTYGIIADQDCTLTVKGSLDNFATSDTIFTHAITANTYTTPYLLAGAMAGPYVIITRPFIQLTLTDTSTVNHTYTRLYAKAWW